MNDATKNKEEFYIQWHFMNGCNLRCKHCYQEEYSHKELPFEKLMMIASSITDALRKWNMVGRISLTGGEPFFSRHLFQLLNFFDNSDVIKQIDVLTNGTLIRDEDINKLNKINKLHQVQISMDGPNAAVHDSIRGQGVFNKVVKNIKKLKEAKIEVSLMFTLMKQNMKYSLDMLDFAERCGVNAITIERVTPCGHTSLSDALSSQEIKEIYREITIRANSISNSLTVRRLRPLWINTCDLNANPEAKIGGFCPVGLTSLAILWDGTALPCRRLEIPISNVLTDGIYKIWYDSEVLWKIRDKRNLQGKCHDCKNVERFGGCRAIAFAMTGDYMGEDVQCWI